MSGYRITLFADEDHPLVTGEVHDELDHMIRLYESDHPKLRVSLSAVAPLNREGGTPVTIKTDTNLCLAAGDRIRDKFDRVGTVRRAYPLNGKWGALVAFDNGTLVDIWQHTIREVLPANSVAWRFA